MHLDEEVAKRTMVFIIQHPNRLKVYYYTGNINTTLMYPFVINHFNTSILHSFSLTGMP